MQDFDWNILVSLYKTKSITQSATALYMTQPALTKRLHSIESELGCTIVIRYHTGLDFTPEGELIVKKAMKILSVIDEIQNDITQYQSGTTGAISIGVPYSYVRFVLPSLLEEYTKRYPNVIINITSEMSDNLVKDVKDGLLDLCFARTSIVDHSLERTLISNDQIYAVYNRPFTLDELPELPYIEYSKNPTTVAASKQWWADTFKVSQKTRLYVQNGDACLSMVQHGIGYGIFLDRAYFEQDESLYSIPLSLKDGTQFTRTTWLLSPKGLAMNPCAENFLQVAKEYFKK